MRVNWIPVLAPMSMPTEQGALTELYTVVKSLSNADYQP
jgi:hypothetical protein